MLDGPTRIYFLSFNILFCRKMAPGETISATYITEMKIPVVSYKLERDELICVPKCE